MISTNSLSGGLPFDIDVYTKTSVQDTLVSCGLDCKVIDYHTTLTCTIYDVILDNIKDILKLEKVKKVLAFLINKPFTLEAKNGIVEFSVMHKCIIDLKNTLQDSLDFSVSGKQTACIGIDLSGKQVLLDFKNLSHVLVAGTTGSGKSVLLNSLIASLHFTTSPDDMMLFLVDCKQVEMSAFKRYKTVAQVINDVDTTKDLLSTMCDVMDSRYRTMETTGLKRWNGTEYYIVIDELADLMLTSGYEIEQYLIRLAQKSRAAGIHLILATQRPTVNVITGLIKANIPTRIALKVASVRDSMVIIDHKGAEKLTGNGDGLIKLPDKVDEIRFQTCLTSALNIKEIEVMLRYA